MVPTLALKWELNNSAEITSGEGSPAPKREKHFAPLDILNTVPEAGPPRGEFFNLKGDCRARSFDLEQSYQI